ncbi:MAG: hypothetical protein BRC33_04235 [Cyanobacteria bacterium SW_9_44_58]|nr:MAG: hypothetical protein BRC33_04235 [Cyanobacteria bacterium SW_9_44_58]
MFHHNTDLEWQKFGNRDPYFAVITDKNYQTGNLNDQNKEEFFQTGYNYIAVLGLTSYSSNID